MNAIATGSRQKRAMELAEAEEHERMLGPRVAGLAVDPYWTPLGPSVVAHGQAEGNPPVSGRIPTLVVGPGGTRAYAGAANGGVWYSENSGASWTPIDLYALTGQPAKLSKMEADSLAIGAVAVKFGATAAADLIFAGTGEPQSKADSPTASAPNQGDSYFGVGIKSSPSGGTAPVWTLEATNLAGHGIFRIVIDPENSAVVFAATSRGLFMRPQSAPFTTWTQVAGFPNPNNSVSDLLVAGRGANKVWFAVFWGDQVFMSTDAHSSATGGTWTAVGTAAGPLTFGSRVALAASETTPPIVYALDGNFPPALYRLDSPTGKFSAVTGVPNALFFGGQGYYDIALAVDPSNSSAVYMAGDTIAHNDWNLSIYKGTITGPPGSYVFPFNPANDMTGSGTTKDSSHVSSDPTWIGQAIHADGHCIAFATNADGTHDGTNVWVGCDGGLFQSTQSGARGTFQPRNLGLAITQLTYMAQHPLTDTALMAGAQDQGNLRFRGDQVCFEAPEGDGGGVAYDPNNGYNAMRQYNKVGLYTATDGGASGNWTDLSVGGKFLPVGSSPTDAQKAAAAAEAGNAAFYGPLAAVAADATHTVAAFGTNRLWITTDWGNTWVTLPSNANPYAAGGANGAIDALGGSVTAIAWASPARVLVATQNSVFQLDQSGGNWTPNPPVPLSGDNGLPAGRFITALALENGMAGGIYAALGGGSVDHVWYYDPAQTKWVTAGLAAATLDVPAHSIVVDPAHTEQVYLATDVGVFKGVKAGAAWTWTSFSNNLPECAVTCLSLHPITRVLRAATHGLGIWEIPLDVPNVPDPDLYLRANPADSGRAPRPAWLNGIADPTTPGSTLTLSASPDIKALTSSKTIATTPDLLAFASLQGFETDLNSFDSFGVNQILIEIHNRGKTPVAGAQVKVALLLADATGALPALPADFATRIQNGDATAWLGSTGWKFADPTSPYRTPPGAVETRVPQVVQYNIDFSAINLTPSHLCAAAFVTTDTDPLTSAVTDIGALAVADKHVATRTLDHNFDWRPILAIVLIAVGVAAVVVVAEEVK